MQIKIDDLLKHSVVISINNETYNRFKNIFEQQNLTPIPKLYSGMKLYGVGAYWEPKNKICNINTMQCMYSHLSLIKMAKFLDWPFICIFEDDAYPCRNCYNYLKDLLQDIPNDIKCLILGYCYIEKHVYEYSQKISYCDLLYGAQSYIIFKNGYDNYIKLTEIENCLADRILDRMSNSYCSNYNMFIQYNNITSTVTNRNGYSWWKSRNANDNNLYSNDIIFSQFPKIEEYQQ